MKYREFLWLSFVVSIPISQRMNVLATVFLVLDFLYLLFVEKKAVQHNNKILLLTFIYFSSVIGLLYTSNFIYAESILETRFTILLFPFLLFYSPVLINRKFLNQVFLFFAFATFGGSLFLLFQAFILFLGDYHSTHFIYTNLAGSFHPSYFSMYVSFSIAILLFVPISLLPKWLSYLFILYFSIMVFLLMSKMGIIVLIILFLYAIVVKSDQHKLWLNLSLFILSGSLVVFLVYLYSSSFKNKIDNTFNEISTLNQSQRRRVSSTGMRILAWRVSTDIIRENILLGVGTGDAGDELLKAKIQRAWEEKIPGLNAHNQFLQTAIALGLTGLLILLLVIIYPLLLAIKQREHLFILFFILIILNFFVESMLQRQMGVVFYSLFSSLIYGNLISSPERYKS